MNFIYTTNLLLLLCGQFFVLGPAQALTTSHRSLGIGTKQSIQQHFLRRTVHWKIVCLKSFHMQDSTDSLSISQRRSILDSSKKIRNWVCRQNFVLTERTRFATCRSAGSVNDMVVVDSHSYAEEFSNSNHALQNIVVTSTGSHNITESKKGRIVGRFISKEIIKDICRRKPYYVSDWKDGITNWKTSLPAIVFLYFSCMAPVLSFGTIASQITEGSIGVIEFLIASGGAGMAYSILCGQPMAFIAPTGLTLAFISGLFRFCALNNISFFPIYSWIGLWTSAYMVALGIGGSSKLIRYCTRFTDEIFNGLLSVNFIYQAYRSLRRNFLVSDATNLSMPFVSLSMALGTFMSTFSVVKFETSMYFNQKIRTAVKDFGPAMVIIAFSLLNSAPWMKQYAVPTLVVPSKFQLANGRDFLIPLLSVPMNVRLFCALPAVLLTALFFMDHNISVRVANNPDRKLKKGAAYNIDMVVLGLITSVLSVLGLPWMCGATVQTSNHLRAMTKNKYNSVTGRTEVDKVVETRVTGFIVHSLLVATIKLLPMIGYLPIPVVSGVFLYLGRKLMTGNTFLKRIPEAFAERKRLPDGHPVHVIGRTKMNIFTAFQASCLLGLWRFQSNTATSMFFPSAIGMLIAIRILLLPIFFSEKELVALGDPTPKL